MIVNQVTRAAMLLSRDVRFQEKNTSAPRSYFGAEVV
jgi:hypothetical protein